MDKEKQPMINDNEGDTIILRNIVRVIATIIFASSLFFWAIGLMVLPMAFDGGIKANVIIFLFVFLAYPLWGVAVLYLLWWHEKPRREFIVFSCIFLIGVILTIFL